MKPVVSAIYISSGTILLALTCFNSFSGPRYFENIALLFIAIGIIIQIIIFFKHGDGK
ncbi:hypothetical protein ACFCYN_18860 [Gottfriedia sp. NPDC056225]|uniref:hypothetical protein n=1 Tax=Gottfriedia sp. NPDC056225 TaxID=3345751 RepID=UPI0035E11ACC